MSLLVMAAVALGAAVLGGGGAHVYHQNKYDKMRAEYQSKIEELQRRIAELIQKIRQKDTEILKLGNKVTELEDKLRRETAKRDEINRMIEVLLNRQKKLESILHALVLLVTFRIKNWKSEKLEIRRELEQANLKALEVDGLLSRIEQEKEAVLARRESAQLEKDDLVVDQQALMSEVEETQQRMAEVG